MPSYRILSYFLGIVFLAAHLAACMPSQEDITLTIGAAASLTEPLTVIGEEFTETHPDVKLLFNFAGSQQIASQVRQGAPLDVFASASPTYLQNLTAAGLINESRISLFAYNQLVVIFPKQSAHPIQDLNDLARPGLRLVIAASEVPVGAYTLALLENASRSSAFQPGFQQRVLANVVSYENNVKAVVTKVALAEADAGIVYASDVHGLYSQELASLTLDPSLNITAAYPAVVLQTSRFPQEAHLFVEFLTSTRAREILSEYGFSTSPPQ